MERSRLLETEVFQGLSERCLERLLASAEERTLDNGERLFELGEEATRLYVVQSGRIELMLPLSLVREARELRVDSRGPGSAVGWSAFVPPYRFTLSAHAGEPSEVVGIPRDAFHTTFEEDPRSGLRFMTHVCAGVGRRLTQMQALWARELRHAIEGEVGSLASAPQD